MQLTTQINQRGMSTFKVVVANVGALDAEAGVHSEFLDPTDANGSFLETKYMAALPNYTSGADDTDTLLDPVVRAARDIVLRFCELRHISMESSLFIAPGAKRADLPRSNSGLPNAAIMSSIDVQVAQRVARSKETAARVAIIAAYMHEHPYYKKNVVCEHAVAHALRNALLVVYPQESHDFLASAHAKHLMHPGPSFDVVFGVLENDPDMIVALESPGTVAKLQVLADRMFKNNQAYFTPEVFAVDPNPDTPYANQIGIVSRVPYKVDHELISSVVHDCESDDACPVDVYAIRLRRALAIVTGTVVVIAWHGRDTKTGASNHGAGVAYCAEKLISAAATRYSGRKIVVAGDFNFMSFEAAATTQSKLKDIKYLCGNTSRSVLRSPYLDQLASMNRTRAGIGTDQFSKIGVKNNFPKIHAVVPMAAAVGESRLRIVAGTLFSAAVANNVFEGAMMVVPTMFFASTLIVTQQQAFRAKLCGSAERGTPGPDTPLDHLPIALTLCEVSTKSWRLSLFYALVACVSAVWLF